MTHGAQQRPAFVDEIVFHLLHDMRRAGGQSPPRQQHDRHKHAKRDHAEQLIGAAPADMIDEELRGRQQDQHAAAHRRIDHGHCRRQSRAEPAAEQDRVGNIADQGRAEADAKPDGELELPERLRVGGNREGSAKKEYTERIHDARAGAVEQATDQRCRQSADKPGQRIDRNHLSAVPAEIRRDRLQEHRERLAESAADHREHEAKCEHG